MGNVRTRKRYNAYDLGVLGNRNNGIGASDVLAGTTIDFESCVDQTHPGPPYKSGSPLSIVKTKYKRYRSAYCGVKSTLTPVAWYYGHFTVNPHVPATLPSATDYSSYGAIGWNRTHPLHPVANLGVALVELKDLPGMLKQTRDFFKRLHNVSLHGPTSKKRIKDFLFDVKSGEFNAAGDYLNLQFGWVPFVKDLYTAINYREILDKKLRWLRNKNRTSIRRRIELGTVNEATNLGYGPNVGSSVVPTLTSKLYSSGISAANREMLTYEYKRRIWFTAKWRIYMPEMDNLKPGFLGLTSLERHFLGLELNPSVIYQALPWSWLIDWFSNAGDVIENLTLRQNSQVVAEYAYTMCEESHLYTKYGTCECYQGTNGIVNASTPRKRFVAYATTEYVFKGRAAANPYGFGITDDSLSNYQWSILSALGLNRLR